MCIYMNFLKRTFKICKKKTIKKVPDVESLKEKVSIPVTDETIQTSLVLRQAKTYLVNLGCKNRLLEVRRRVGNIFSPISRVCR